METTVENLKIAIFGNLLSVMIIPGYEMMCKANSQNCTQLSRYQIKSRAKIESLVYASPPTQVHQFALNSKNHINCYQFDHHTTSLIVEYCSFSEQEHQT